MILVETKPKRKQRVPRVIKLKNGQYMLDIPP